jgi:hypothetical protein
MKSNFRRNYIMKESIMKFWGDHKEDIKTGAILVLTPIAVMGVVASRGLNNMTSFLNNVSEEIREKK